MSNADAILKSFVAEIVEIEEDRIRAQDSRKDLMKELRPYKVPVGTCLALHRREGEDPKKKEKRMADLVTASAITGIAVAVDESVQVAELGEDVRKIAQEKISIIRSIDEEIAGYKEKLDQKYKDAVENGLTKRALQRVVAFTIDPTKKDKYEGDSLLVDTYLKVLAN